MLRILCEKLFNFDLLLRFTQHLRIFQVNMIYINQTLNEYIQLCQSKDGNSADRYSGLNKNLYNILTTTVLIYYS